MKIFPTMVRGIVFLHEDGTFEMAPLQVFIGDSGNTVIRVGRNAFFFDRDGKFTGTECKTVGLNPDSPETKMLVDAYELQGEGRGLPPEEAYFQPGTPGYEAETRAWPKVRHESDGGVTYGVRASKSKKVEH